MTLPLSAHQRLRLLRRFPDAEIEQRSISSIRILLDGCWMEVYRPPFLRWVVCWPYVTGSMLYPPAEHDIWSLRALLIEWFEASRET